MSTSLSIATHLSGDTLADVAEWLDSHALGALVLCGDATLNHKFAHHVRSVAHRSASTSHFSWPFYIRGWTALKRLRVHPGRGARNLDTQDFVATFTNSPALAERVLDSLPRSLESLHLDEWSLSFKSAFRITWQRHVEQMQTAGIEPNQPTFAHTAGVLAMLHRFYLPNLQSFSMTTSRNARIDSDIRSWTNGAAHVLPLTRLSLSTVSHISASSSRQDESWCNVFLNLPRTLTSLKLGLNNLDRQEDDSIAMDTAETTATTPVPSASLALPPNLTHLSLTFRAPLYVPADILANLSQLQTLKLDARDYAFRYDGGQPQQQRRPMTLASLESPQHSILAYLPASVRTLTLSNYRVRDLQHHLNAIPDEHCGLRHLVITPLGIGRYDNLLDHAEWIHTVTSRAKFRQLETFRPHMSRHLYTFRVFRDDHDYMEQMVEEFADQCKRMSQHALFNEIHQNMAASMTHLRCVSDFFLHPFFFALWKPLAPYLTSATPMRVHCEERSFAIFSEHLSRYDDRWFYEHWYGASSSFSHFTTSRLEMSKSLRTLLYAADNPCRFPPRNPQMVSVRDTLCKSVKHLSIAPDEAEIEALSYWPYALKSLTVASPWSTRPIHLNDETIRWHMNGVRTLRALVIDVTIGVDNLNVWMQSLPKTLEKLKIRRIVMWNKKKNKAVDDSNSDEEEDSMAQLSDRNRLGYMPPNLKRMKLCGAFFIDTRTFDAIPPSLCKIKWVTKATSLHCRTSDLCRWPKCVRRVHIKTASTKNWDLANRKRNEEEMAVLRWYESAKCLEYFNVYSRVSSGEIVGFQHARQC